jgi:hypothetical protein
MNGGCLESIELLKAQNRCLEKFMKFSSKEDLPEEDLMKKMIQRRSEALRAYELFGQKLLKTLQEIEPTQKTPQFIQTMKSHFALQMDLVQTLLRINEEMMEKIQFEISRLSQEILISEKAQQRVQKFKSQWIIQSGEQLDGLI